MRQQVASKCLDLYEIRGAQLAAAGAYISCGGGIFQCESQSQEGLFYNLELEIADQERKTTSCSCKSWKSRRRKRCKHGKGLIRALAQFTAEQIAAWPPSYRIPAVPLPEGLTKRERNGMYKDARRQPKMRIRFPEGTPSEATRRNKAYAIMRQRHPQLLRELALLFETPRLASRGGQELLLHDRFFSVVARTAANCSLNDAVHDLTAMVKLGFVEWAPSKNSLSNYMYDIDLLPVMEEAMFRIGRTVRKLEKIGIVDSTGFATASSANYLDADRGHEVVREHVQWWKVHVLSGGITNIPCALIVTPHEGKIDENDPSQPTADVNFFLPLLRLGCRVWNLLFALGDKAYLSDANARGSKLLGIQSLIPIKRGIDRETKCKEYQDMYDLYFDENSRLFDLVYRYRSKIESVFSAAKRLCSSFIRSRVVKNADGVISAEQRERFRVALTIEMYAKFITIGLRRLVVLEQLHDDRVNFGADRCFEPLPEDWFVPEDIDPENMDDFDDAA